MKYLKPYKIFESNDWIRPEIMDMLSNLVDDDFVVRTSYMGEGNGYVFIRLHENEKNKLFDINLIRPDVLRMIEFLGDRYICDTVVGMKGSQHPTSIDIDDTSWDFLHDGLIYYLKVNLYLKDRQNVTGKERTPLGSPHTPIHESIDKDVVRDIISDISDEFGDTSIEKKQGNIILDLMRKEGVGDFDPNRFARETGYFLEELNSISNYYMVMVKRIDHDGSQGWQRFFVDVIPVQFYRSESLSDVEIEKFEKELMGIRPQLKSNGYDIVRIQYAKKAIYVDICRVGQLEGLLDYFDLDEMRLSVDAGQTDIECGKIVDGTKLSFTRKLPR